MGKRNASNPKKAQAPSSDNQAGTPSSIETSAGVASFKSPTFILDGKKYTSSKVMAAAHEGDEAAQAVIGKLVQIESGVIVLQKGGTE